MLRGPDTDIKSILDIPDDPLYLEIPAYLNDKSFVNAFLFSCRTLSNKTDSLNVIWQQRILQCFQNPRELYVNEDYETIFNENPKQLYIDLKKISRRNKVFDEISKSYLNLRLVQNMMDDAFNGEIEDLVKKCHRRNEKFWGNQDQDFIEENMLNPRSLLKYLLKILFSIAILGGHLDVVKLYFENVDPNKILKGLIFDDYEFESIFNFAKNDALCFAIRLGDKKLIRKLLEEEISSFGIYSAILVSQSEECRNDEISEILEVRFRTFHLSEMELHYLWEKKGRHPILIEPMQQLIRENYPNARDLYKENDFDSRFESDPFELNVILGDLKEDEINCRCNKFYNLISKSFGSILRYWFEQAYEGKIDETIRLLNDQVRNPRNIRKNFLSFLGVSRAQENQFENILIAAILGGHLDSVRHYVLHVINSPLLRMYGFTPPSKHLSAIIATALHHACYCGTKDLVVQLLPEVNSFPDLYYAYDTSFKEGHEEISDILKEKIRDCKFEEQDLQMAQQLFEDNEFLAELRASLQQQRSLLGCRK